MGEELKSKKGTYTIGIAVLIAVAHVAIAEVHAPRVAAAAAVLRTRPIVVVDENSSTNLLDLSI